jgi:CRP-like cAMP-binding protein
MAKTQGSAGPYNNILLAHLSAETIGVFSRHLEPIQLENKLVIYEQGQPMRYAYFPETGMISVVSVMDDGRSIEVGTIGREGVAGATILLGADRVPYQHYIQIVGHGHRIKSAQLKAEAERSAEFRNLILRYQAAFLTQTMQTTACNGLHNVQQRCCRWILMSQDKVQSETVPLTHEFLGLMLGVRRASVSEVLQPLQTCGWIRSHRGEIAVLNRKGLLTGSCECYQLIVNHYAELLK